MSHSPPHPDDQRLKSLIGGNLAVADEAAVLELIEREPVWQQALDRVAADDATWRAAADALNEPPLAADATLRSMLAEVGLSSDGASSANTPAIGETVDSSAGESAGPADLSFLAPSEDPAYIGRLGSYLVEEVVGRGGFGVVLKARDPKLARVVAVKVLAPHLATSGTACQRFLREARAAAAVVHEHIITIYAVEDRPLPHLVMQYVAGQSLQEKLDRGGPLGLAEVLRIGIQMAAGLAAAHRQGLVHRDIKPANILLENGIERVKITDFGLARAADDASLTRSGVVAGTPQYMSPEQARGASVDARSDVFSLGSVLYAMCTGRPPFRAETTLAVLNRVCEEAARPIRELNPEIPLWLAAIIDRLMAKQPGERLGSAQEVADLMGQCLSHVQQPQFIPLPAAAAALAAAGLSASQREPPVRGPAHDFQPVENIPGENAMLSPMPTKPARPAKPDPFADAPGTPVRSRLRQVLTGLALIAGGLSVLACCAGVGSFFFPQQSPFEPSGQLVIEMPDHRLTAKLRADKIYGVRFRSGDALQSAQSELEVVPGSNYSLAPGEYRLRVMSDDVVVFSDLIRIDSSGSALRYEVKPGGILHIHAEPRGGFVSVTINGEICISNVMQTSRRMLVVPEGTVRVKSMWGTQVYGERLVEVKAGKELLMKASAAGVEEVPPMAAPAQR